MNKFFSILALVGMLSNYVFLYSIDNGFFVDLSFMYGYMGFILGIMKIFVIVAGFINIGNYVSHNNKIISNLSIVGLILVFGSIFGVIPTGWIADIGIILVAVSSFIKDSNHEKITK